MTEFNARKIGDLGRVVTGKTPKTARNDFFDGPYPFVTIPDLNGRVFIDSSSRTISQAGAETIKTSLLPAGSVMMSCIATVGRCGITDRPSFTNQQINSVIPNEDVDPLFLFYVFRVIGQYLEVSGGGGSVYTNVSKSRFSEIEVNIPSLPDQRLIAATLGALDEKINLNSRMNETLEAIAHAMFKDWFVDLGPTHAKMEGGEPYLTQEIWDLFPDKLDEDGKPERWESKPLHEIAKQEKDSVKPQDAPDELFEHFSIPAFDSSRSPAMDAGSEIKSNKTLIPDNAVLLSKLNPEIQRVWFPRNKGEYRQICSTEFLVYTPQKPFGRSYLYSAFSECGFRDLLTGMVTGTSKSHQRVNATALATQRLTAPDEGLVHAFEKTVCPLLDRVLHNQADNESLAAIRDTLLPKLMSGEIRISEVEKAA